MESPDWSAWEPLLGEGDGQPGQDFVVHLTTTSLLKKIKKHP